MLLRFFDTGALLNAEIAGGSATCAPAAEGEIDWTLPRLAVGESFSVSVSGTVHDPDPTASGTSLGGALSSDAFYPAIHERPGLPPLDHYSTASPTEPAAGQR